MRKFIKYTPRKNELRSLPTNSYLKLNVQSKEDKAKAKKGSSAPGEEEHVIFQLAEAVFVGWFTFEYIIRYIAAPQKWK